jgi:hypothetical protein
VPAEPLALELELGVNSAITRVPIGVSGRKNGWANFAVAVHKGTSSMLMT